MSVEAWDLMQEFALIAGWVNTSDERIVWATGYARTLEDIDREYR